MKEKLKKYVVKPVSTVASITYTFIEGSITPGIIAFMDKFWFGGMKPHNDDELPILADSPASVRAFITGMAAMGLINVVDQKVYLAKKAKYLNNAKDNRLRLEHMRLEIQDCLRKLEHENNILKNTTAAQDKAFKIVIFFSKKILETIKKEDYDSDYLNNLFEPQRIKLASTFNSSYLELFNIEVRHKHLKPAMVDAFDQELKEIKLDTQTAQKFMFNGFKGWLAIAALTGFATVANFGVPVVFAMTIHALLQDLLVLPYGQDIIYAVVSLAFISGIYNGLNCFTTLLSQKRDENDLLLYNANLFEDCADGLEKIMRELQTNSSTKGELRKVMGIAETSVQQSAYPFEFKLYKDVQMRSQNALRFQLIESKPKHEDEENENEPLLATNGKSVNSYDQRQYIPLSRVFK